MPKIDLKYIRLPADEKLYGTGFSLNSITQKEFDSFNPELLGLGDLSKDGEYINALAAFLDLQGFTDFCNQLDSHLVIPEFVRRYTNWLFNEIAEQFKEGSVEGRVKIWGSLPFYAKFLGDGILFLWNTDNCIGKHGIINVISRLLHITQKYKTDFIPEIQKHVSKPPLSLRCGISRGQIISLGTGQDYVGSCINMASRLQKISLLTFAVSRRGFDLSPDPNSGLNKRLVLKKIKIQGIGNDELIYILKSEYTKLTAKEKKVFNDIE